LNGTEATAQHRALAGGGLLVLLWGASFTIQKVAYEALSPGGYLFGRSLLMSACAVALLVWRRSPVWPQLDTAEWRTLLMATAIGPVGHVALVTYGLHWSTPFSGSLIMACGPVCTLLLLRLRHGTRLSRGQVAGVALAFAGVLLLMSDKLAAADLRASGGDLVMLAAVLAFAYYTVVVTPLAARHGGAEVMGWSTLISAPLMLAIGTPAAWQLGVAGVSPPAWAAFVWTVVVSGFVGWILWSWVNTVRGVARTAPLLYGVPPVAGIVAALTVGESFGPLKLLGAVAALGGVAWTQAAGRHPRPAASGQTPR